MTAAPLVWIVTPVHNGERFLSECIESVLAQTYENWRYLVVDNCSIDRTAEIVSLYAEKDRRVQLERCVEFLPIIENWNRALRMIPSDATYCKVVHADDTLFPKCLEKMVDLAERHPSVAAVTSYAVWGDEVRHHGVPYGEEVADGHTICRSTLLGECYVFGSPTSLLLRASDVRARPDFYNAGNYHADTEICFDLLQSADLGFAHEILTSTRVHPEAMTSFSVRVNTFHFGWLAIHLKYGRSYLSKSEYYGRLVYRLSRYASFLVKAVVKLKFRDRRFREHHGKALRCLADGLTSGRSR